MPFWCCCFGIDFSIALVSNSPSTIDNYRTKFHIKYKYCKSSTSFRHQCLNLNLNCWRRHALVEMAPKDAMLPWKPVPIATQNPQHQRWFQGDITVRWTSAASLEQTSQGSWAPLCTIISRGHCSGPLSSKDLSDQQNLLVRNICHN